MTAIGIGMAVASATSAAVQQHKAGKAAKAAGAAEKRSAYSQARLFDINAQMADAQADDVIAAGALEEQEFRTQVKGVMGSIRAGQAAGNVDVSHGSALDVYADAAFLGELDALQIRTNALRASWGYRVEAYDYRLKADITRQEGNVLGAAGDERARAARWATFGSVLGAGASLLQLRYGFSRDAMTGAYSGMRSGRGGVLVERISPDAAGVRT